MDTKKCTKCTLIKLLSEFYKGRTECKDCSKKYKKDNALNIKLKKQEYDLENKDRIAQVQNEYAKNNPDKIKARKKKWVENNKDQVREYHKKRYQENKEEIRRQHKQYYENNKTGIQLKHKAWRLEHQEEIKQYAKKISQDENFKRRRREWQKEWRKLNKFRLAIKRRFAKKA